MDEYLYICYGIKDKKYLIFTESKTIGETKDWCEALKIFRSHQSKLNK